MTPPRPPARYLALGDSYTIGEGLTDPAGRWPAQLVAQLRATGERIDDAVVVARTGWTTSDLLAAAPRKADPAYDLVTVMIGVNNQYRGHRTDRFRRELTDLLARAVALAGGNAARLVVTSIPDWGASPFAAGRDRAQVAREIDAYNAVIRDVLAAHAGATYVDVTATSREFAGDRANFTPDGLHYSAVACARYAALVLPACRKVVAGR
ncbi:MAG: SGNH/GDSL hydrolase family protein [Planctomycetota bacterium]